MSEAGPVLYDPVELRGRIVVCFSVGELKELADSLGVGGVPWERGIHEAAREVVRQCERYAGLPALVAKLREVRPLVEWPEPAGAVTVGAIAPGRPLPPTLASEGGLAALPAGPPQLSSSPGTFGAMGAMGAAPAGPRSDLPATGGPLIVPYAPPPGPPAIQVPPPPPAATGVSAAPAFRAGWPGVVGEPPAPAPGGIDPRILLAVAGLMVVAAIIAYFAGRASTAAAPTEASQAASAAPAAASGPARSGGPAALASEALARSFADLARICELPSSAGANARVIQRVFERCGPGAPPRRPYSPPSPSQGPSADASAQPAPPAEPAPARGRRGGRSSDGPPGEAPSAAKGCTGACEATHGACRSHCGPEPTESSAYDGYQRCLGRCLSDASRCKLGCH